MYADGANRASEGHNPLCGDHVVVHLALEGDVVKDVGFQGQGCAISTASASLMTEAIKGKSVHEVKDLFERFHALVTSRPSDAVDTADLGKLSVFAGVREFPMRVKCATLCWHTLCAALDGDAEHVTTE